MTTSTAPTSLRQRKKNRTRAQLRRVSWRLFLKQGYDATTLEQICAQAEVSVATLLGYFESKERLALAANYDALEQFREALESPERDADTLTHWRAWAAQSYAALQRNRESMLRWQQDPSAALARGRLAYFQQVEETLTRALAAEFGTDPETDLPTMMLATMLVNSNRTLLRQWVAHGGETDIVPQAMAVIDFAIARFPRPGNAFLTE
jgi:AcrR family transcriptional regulator